MECPHHRNVHEIVRRHVDRNSVRLETAKRAIRSVTHGQRYLNRYRNHGWTPQRNKMVQENEWGSVRTSAVSTHLTRVKVIIQVTVLISTLEHITTAYYALTEYFPLLHVIASSCGNTADKMPTQATRVMKDPVFHQV
jgi:hypothetical protein